MTRCLRVHKSLLGVGTQWTVFINSFYHSDFCLFYPIHFVDESHINKCIGVLVSQPEPSCSHELELFFSFPFQLFNFCLVCVRVNVNRNIFMIFSHRPGTVFPSFCCWQKRLKIGSKASFVVWQKIWMKSANKNVWTTFWFTFALLSFHWKFQFQIRRAELRRQILPPSCLLFRIVCIDSHY